MAEPLKDIREWLESFPARGHSLAVGDKGLELVVLDRFNRRAGTFEIGGTPDRIPQLPDGPAGDLTEDGMEPGCVCEISADAEHVTRTHKLRRQFSP